jgi:hypothetical protein
MHRLHTAQAALYEVLRAVREVEAGEVCDARAMDELFERMRHGFKQRQRSVAEPLAAKKRSPSSGLPTARDPSRPLLPFGGVHAPPHWTAPMSNSRFSLPAASRRALGVVLLLATSAAGAIDITVDVLGDPPPKEALIYPSRQLP